MHEKSMILQIPVEILQRIAHYACHTGYSVHTRSPLQPPSLLSFRLTCKALEKASFDVLIEKYPQKLCCHVSNSRSIENLKVQISQPRLASRLIQITLTLDILAGSDSSDIQTAETEDQELEDAQLFDYQRLEAESYDQNRSVADTSLLSTVLQELQRLANPQAINIDAWTSEDVYIEHDESKNVVTMLSSIMDAVPPNMLHVIYFAYVHCNPDSIMRLMRRSHDKLEGVTMDNVSFVSSEPQWREFLVELSRCTYLNQLSLCNLHEGCYGEVLSTRQRSRYSPFLGYLHAGFSGLGTVSEGVRVLIEAELSPEEATEGYDLD